MELQVCNSATVTEPDSIQVTATVTDASCATCCDGDIQLIVTGGTPPYLVVFSSPSPYCPGNYNYCVLDYNNCSYCDSAEVSFYYFLSMKIIIQHLLCYIPTQQQEALLLCLLQ